MRFFNCSMEEALRRLAHERIVLFGSGSYLKSLFYSRFFQLSENFLYVVDNSPREFSCRGKTLNAYRPEKLREEPGCTIILTSPVYMYDMYVQLEGMGLGDGFTCYAFPFMQLVSDPELDESLLREVTDFAPPVIPKTVHTFWFSGERKPPEYQRCVDTWAENLPGWEIIEWNQSNYDCGRHPFVRRAIEERAWALASDYTRLDVLDRYGGMYLDTDVEVFRPFDDLLGNDTILAYANNVQVDLAVLGSKRDNPLLKEMLALYDGITLPPDRNSFSRYFQPALVKPLLFECGIRMDGSLQRVGGATVFPRQFFMPQDHILFNPLVKSAHTYCNHLDNFGWSYSGESKREKKITDNRKLWKLIEPSGPES